MRTPRPAKVILSLVAGFLLTILPGHWKMARGDETVTLGRNHPAHIARILPGAAPVAADRILKMEIVFALRNRSELDQLLKDQQDSSSLQYRHWLSPAEFTKRFGPSQSDVANVRTWLAQEGFAIESASTLRRNIRFSGTATQANKAFRVSIVGSSDRKYFANTADPSVPARFGVVIESIRGMSNLQAIYSGTARAASRPHFLEPFASGVALSSALNPQISPGTGQEVQPDYYAAGFGPADAWSFYDEDALLNSGINGSSECIAVIEPTDFLTSAVSTFNRIFSLPRASLKRVYVPGNRGINEFEVEALLDIEWAHAAAPNAPITTYLDYYDLSGAFAAAITDDTCASITVSYGLCSDDVSFYQWWDGSAAQAAAQGQSVFVSSGDYGAAGLVFDPYSGCVPATSRGVSELAATPNATAVGGTEFWPNYDSSGYNVGSVPELAWNEEYIGMEYVGGGATGGGASSIFLKPSYQAGPGVPADGKRDIPDIAMGAGVRSPGFYFVFDYYGTPWIWCCVGGTSIGPPIWSGIANLAVQAIGQRVGNLNPSLYQFAQEADPLGNGLRDVTQGNNNYNHVIGFAAGPGYDQATGLGTPDVADLVAAFKREPPPPPAIVRATLGVAPKVMRFTPQTVLGNNGVTSKPRYVILSNPKNAAQNVSINILGLNTTGEFSVADSSCVGPLRAGAQCKVPVTFTPTGAGVRPPGQLLITANTKFEPAPVALSGSGVTGRLKYAPLSLTFGRVAIGQSGTSKTVTLTNNNGVPMELGTIAASAGFEIAANSCGATLTANGGACSVSVAFAPSTLGRITGTLTIPDNAAGNPHLVKLVGVGVAAVASL